MIEPLPSMQRSYEAPMSSHRSSEEHAPSDLAVGYHRIHPDASINYQMNRFSTGAPDMIAEMREVAPKIRDYAGYTREFLGLSEQALERGELLKAAYYLRSAEFFMFPGDQRKQAARGRFVRLMREHFGVAEDANHLVPYGSWSLSSYRFTLPAAQGAIVLFGGFDSYIEELFPILLYLRDAGFDVIGFEGPGQGAVLEGENLPMTPEWEKPVGAVLDYFQLKDVTLLGYSLGGCLAIRAAAHEPRVRRVVADDIFTDLFEISLRQAPTGARAILAALLRIGAASAVNALVERAMKRSLGVEWGVRQGMHVTGARSPYEYLKQTQRYRTDDVSHRIEQDVLLLAGAEDHYVPLRQLQDQIRSLTAARSLSARVFRRQESAQNHVHVGNVGLSLRVIAAWITEHQRKEVRATLP
jgi:pimeloyl-ACP methyl ester carboxylesterase